MKHNSSILLVLYFLVGGLIGLSLNAYAQTSNPIRYNDDNILLIITINNVTVVEKNNTPYITMDVGLEMQNLGQTEAIVFLKNNISLVNEQGGEYKRTDDCPGSNVIGIEGWKGAQANFPDCFNVDKRFNSYSIHYWDSYTRKSLVIGNIDLTQISNGQITTSSSNPSTSNSPTSSINQLTTNIFEQFMNFLKQIFHFMILGTSFLNDS